MRQQLKRVENRTHRDDSRLTMKSQLIAIAAAVLIVGCGESQQSVPPVEAKPAEPVATPEPPTAKASDIDIHEAAVDGNIEAVKQHLAAGVNVNAKDETSWTPLHFATTKAVAELLITKGADVNAKNDTGETPLHQAAFDGHRETVELLIAKGSSVNDKNNDGMTPQHFAVGHPHKGILELLIDKGADVNAKNILGGTLLHIAALNGFKEFTELLIAKGADVNAKDRFGKTPLDSSSVSKQTESADLLRKHGGKTGEELKAEGK